MGVLRIKCGDVSVTCGGDIELSGSQMMSVAVCVRDLDSVSGGAHGDTEVSGVVR